MHKVQSNRHVVYVSVVLILREPYYTLGVRSIRKFGLEITVIMCTIFPLLYLNYSQLCFLDIMYRYPSNSFH
jgi:hypothetical protein